MVFNSNRQMTKKEALKKFKILSSIYDISKLLTSTLDSRGVLKLVMEKVGELLDAKNWSMLMVDQEKQELYFEIVVGDNADKIKDLRIKIDAGIAGWVATNGKPLLLPDVSKDPRFFSGVDKASGFTTQSIICTPMIIRGSVLGVIELINKNVGEFTEEDLQTLIHLTDFIAIAIDNARNFAKIQELTVKDDLTCLYNTRFFHDMLEKEISRSMRKKHKLSLIFMDMDHFKDVNDTHGHLYGSRLLKQVAEIIMKTIRSTDIAIRYGGDEFVVILPETGKEATDLAARRILKNIQNFTFLHDEGLNLKQTASLGYATFPDDADTKEELIKKADNAMYEVKNTTRNSVRAA